MKNVTRVLFMAIAQLSISCGCLASPDKIGVVSHQPSVAPSGKDIAFAANFEGSFRIWSSSISGGALRRLSSVYPPLQGTRDSDPAWSPDGRKLAFSSSTGATADIWVIQADGTIPVKLVSNGATNSAPAWSPDGQKLAFVSDKDGTNDIWLVNADGSQPRKLFASQAEENWPSFSPDGSQIVFTQTNDNTSLMIVGVNGGGPRALTSGAFEDWEPSWGSKGILFSSNREKSGAWKIWVVQPDGSGLQKLGDVRGHGPRWLPDGRIVFADEAIASQAASALSIFNPLTGIKQVVADIQGFITPIDVRPRKASNEINPRSLGKVQVAILSTRSFDATTAVVQKSLTFGRTGSESSLSSCAKQFPDVNGDGIPDLVCRFDLRYARFQPGDTAAVVRFTDAGGKTFEGRDAITTVTQDDPEDFKD